MLMPLIRSRLTFPAAAVRLGAAVCGALALGLTLSAPAQQPGAAPQPAAAVSAAPPAAAAQSDGIHEEELKQLLVGKPLYLRGGYLDNTLSFDEHGRLIGHSLQGSYTLSAIEIDKVRLSRRKVELQGVRYGLHFVGQLPYEDPSTAFDRVRITPRKKVVKISIQRETVTKPRKKKEPKAGKEKGKKATPAAPAAAEMQAATPAAQQAPPVAQLIPEPAGQPPASITAAPQAGAPSGSENATAVISPAHAAQALREALDQIFAQGLDERMMAAMPDFWKLYYQAAAAKADYRPADPTVFLQSAVDRKAALLTKFEPESNEFAQANGVAGMALYHAVIGPDGKAGEVAVGRPIGFGLDENAVAAIRKASFQPAIRDGKPVAVLLDLVVQFRIFSKRTAVAGLPEPAGKATVPVLPGPYSVPQP